MFFRKLEKTVAAQTPPFGARVRREKGVRGRNPAAPEPKRSPAALLGQSRSQRKSFLFLLEEKIRRAQIKKCEESFFAGWRASASGGGAERVSFAQNRFGLCRIIPPRFDFREFARRVWPRFARQSRRTGNGSVKIAIIAIGATYGYQVSEVRIYLRLCHAAVYQQKAAFFLSWFW